MPQNDIFPYKSILGSQGERFKCHKVCFAVAARKSHALLDHQKRCTALLHCTAQHCTALRCAALHCTTPYNTVIAVRHPFGRQRVIAVRHPFGRQPVIAVRHPLYCTVPHCTALHYATLRYAILHYTTLGAVALNGDAPYRPCCQIG